MKVLFVTYCRVMLGANRSMLNLMLDLRNRYQVEPYVLMPEKEDGTLYEELQKCQIPCFVFPMKHWVVDVSQKHKTLRGISARIKNCYYVRKMLPDLKKENFSLIYTNNSTVQTGACLAEMLNIPHIWHIREFGREDYSVCFSYPNYMVKKLFKKADSIITISKALENHFRKNVAELPQITTIYNGVRDFGRERTEWNLNDTLRFCCIGALNEGKNQRELLEAAVELLKRNIRTFSISIVGDGGDYSVKLKNFISENKLEAYVHMTGYRADIENVLFSSDVGVIPSKAEAFGRVTCEYMLAGMPAIGAKSGGTTELISDGEDGILYSVGDVTALADAMQYFIEHREAVKEMGITAKNKAKEKFTVNRNTDAVYEEIRKVAEYEKR